MRVATRTIAAAALLCLAGCAGDSGPAQLGNFLLGLGALLTDLPKAEPADVPVSAPSAGEAPAGHSPAGSQ